VTNKLRTLKDFEGDSADLFVDDAIVGSQLKQEAINWIKELERGIEIDPWNPMLSVAPSPRFMFGGNLKEQNRAIISFIKHFFNITEEDLSQ